MTPLSYVQSRMGTGNRHIAREISCVRCEGAQKSESIELRGLCSGGSQLTPKIRNSGCSNCPRSRSVTCRQMTQQSLGRYTPSSCCYELFGQRDICPCRYVISGYHSDELSNAKQLHEYKRCSRSGMGGGSLVLVYSVYSASTNNLICSTLHKGDGSRLTICGCHSWKLALN